MIWFWNYYAKLTNHIPEVKFFVSTLILVCVFPGSFMNNVKIIIKWKHTSIYLIIKVCFIHSLYMKSHVTLEWLSIKLTVSKPMSIRDPLWSPNITGMTEDRWSIINTSRKGDRGVSHFIWWLVKSTNLGTEVAGG